MMNSENNEKNRAKFSFFDPLVSSPKKICVEIGGRVE